MTHHTRMHRGRGGSIGKQLMRSVRVRQRVLCRQQALCGRSVPFAFRILLERVRNRYGAIAKVLSVHGIHGRIRRFEAGEVYESKSLRVARLRIAHNLWRLQDHSEGGERVVQQLLVHLQIQVADENVRPHIQALLVGGSLVHTDRFAVQLDHVHDFDRIVGVFLAQKLDEPVTLVHLCDTILRHVHVHHGSALNEQFPKQRLRNLIVQSTNVNRCIWK